MAERINLRLRASRGHVISELLPSNSLAAISFEGRSQVTSLSRRWQKLLGFSKHPSFPPKGIVAFGRALAKAAFSAGMLAEIESVLRKSTQAQTVAEIAFQVSEDIAHLPWECVYLGEENSHELATGYLFRNPAAMCYRLSESIAQPTFPPGDQVRVLIAWANPGTVTAPPLYGMAGEVATIRTALCRLPGVVITELPHATPASLQRSLTEDRPSIFHFLGHSGIGFSGGYLVLEGAEVGTHVNVVGSRVAAWVQPGDLEVAILSCCHSGGNPVSMAHELNPCARAVISMQLAVDDSRQVQFIRALYGSIADGRTAAQSVQEARSVFLVSDSAWIAPVLTVSGDAVLAAPLRNDPDQSVEPKLGNIRKGNIDFVGRANELLDLDGWVRSENEPLRVITGLGGMGKTRLAHEAALRSASQFPDGIWTIDCGDLRSGDDLASAMTSTLKVPFFSEQDPFAKLSDQKLLVILDSFEKVAGKHSWDVLQEFFRKCPYAKVIVTSRAAFKAHSSRTIRLGPLEWTADSRRVSESEALLTQAAGMTVLRERLGREERDTFREILLRLEGIPLSILLAASKLRFISPRDLLTVLDQRRNADGQKNSFGLIDIISQAIGSLPADAAEVLWLLQVFTSTFTLGEICAVLARSEYEVMDILGTLCESHLLQVERDGSIVRYRLLDSIRDYLATNPAVSDQAEDLLNAQRRHADLYSVRAESLDRSWRERRRQPPTRTLWDDLPDFRSAFKFAFDRGLADHVEVIAKNLIRPLLESGYWSDVETMAAGAFWAADCLEKPRLRADVLGLLGALRGRRGDGIGCRELWLERAKISEKIGDLVSCADSYCDLAAQSVSRRSFHEAKGFAIRGLRLARAADAKSQIATALLIRSSIAVELDRPRIAELRANQAQQISILSEDWDSMLFVDINVAETYLRLGQHKAAREALARGLFRATKLGRKFHSAQAMLAISELFELKGDYHAALTALVGSLRYYTELGSEKGQTSQLRLERFFLEHSEVRWRRTYEHLTGQPLESIPTLVLSSLETSGIRSF